MTAYEIIRLIGAEFALTEDETIEQWIEYVRPLVSKKQFGKLYNHALALRACHSMKMAGLGESATDGVGGLTTVGGGSGGVSVASVSDGGTSLSFNSGAGNWVFADAELTLTTYGQQYIQLRHECIVPIHVRGEWC